MSFVRNLEKTDRVITARHCRCCSGISWIYIKFGADFIFFVWPMLMNFIVDTLSSLKMLFKNEIRHNFQIKFSGRKLLYFAINFTEICSKASSKPGLIQVMVWRPTGNKQSPKTQWIAVIPTNELTPWRCLEPPDPLRWPSESTQAADWCDERQLAWECVNCWEVRTRAKYFIMVHYMCWL